MIGSRQGWVEAPYVASPAPLDRLAQGLVRTPDAALAIVPGVSSRDDHGVPDVMRGEETQIFGALADDAATTLVVLPGTHSKWALAGAGRIETFVSFMTGEVYAVLKTHSILGRLMTEPETPSTAAFLRGVRAAQTTSIAPGALLHQLFGARTLALFDELEQDGVADYLSGLLIGSEVVAGRAWAASCGIGDGAPVAALIGAPTLTERYGLALRATGVDVRAGDALAAARGLWRIARAAALVR
jgi:2-dehydro-3-deoxygalactonokinase